MGSLALTAAFVLDRPLVDPEGFLGPSWLRLPLLVLGAFLLDVLPRTLWGSRMKPALMPAIARERVRTHWDKDRIVLTVLGLVCFYITYVSYRNLKSFLPFIMGEGAWDKFPNVKRLVDEIGARPAAQRAEALKTRYTFKTEMDDEARGHMFKHLGRKVA